MSAGNGEGDMLPYQLKSGEKAEGMVTLVVTIDEELLRRFDTSLHLGEKEGETSDPDLAAEGINRVEVGEKELHSITNNEPGHQYNQLANKNINNCVGISQRNLMLQMGRRDTYLPPSQSMLMKMRRRRRMRRGGGGMKLIVPSSFIDHDFIYLE